jgi:hypothetical protein
MLHVEAYPLPRRTNQLAVFNRIAFAPGIRQKRILLQSFVRESAAAGLLPGKLFVKEKDVPSSRRQQPTSQSARWTASDNCKGMLRTHVVGNGSCRMGGRLAGVQQHSATALASFLRGGVGSGFPRIRSFPLIAAWWRCSAPDK